MLSLGKQLGWSINFLILTSSFVLLGTSDPIRARLKWPQTGGSCNGSRWVYLQRHFDAQVTGIPAKWGQDGINTYLSLKIPPLYILEVAVPQRGKVLGASILLIAGWVQCCLCALVRACAQTMQAQGRDYYGLVIVSSGDRILYCMKVWVKIFLCSGET